MHRSSRLNRRVSELGLLLATAFYLSADPLQYAPAPPDNALKGFVPYLGERSTFPHSMEWDYTRLSDVMTGPDAFSWETFEAKLHAAASRGHQFYARFYLEWPGRKTAVPQYLIDDGLTLRRWTNTNTQPFPPAVDFTPDYEDARLRAALTNFIHAFGARYDGDPRLGFVGLGLLGTWGEWHNHPNNQWFASKTVQREVLDAYQAAFRRTRLVARYPAGPEDPTYADNSLRAIGYHDDSFAWATVHTGKNQNSWFFESRLRRADALAKWRSQPIGGEVRPEVWDCLFDDPSCAPEGQEFLRCVQTVHASWLSNEGVFRRTLSPASRQRAIRAAQQLGYELHITDAVSRTTRAGDELFVTLTVTNTGVAPFYYGWAVELGACDTQRNLVATWSTPWTLSDIQPGMPLTPWATRVNIERLPEDSYQLLARAPNPLPHASPVRFANTTQDQHLTGWLSLGEFDRRTTPQPRSEADVDTTARMAFHIEFIRPTAQDTPATSQPEPLRTFIAKSARATSPEEQLSIDQIDWLGTIAPASGNLPVQLIAGPGVVGIENPAANGTLRLDRLKRQPGIENWTAPVTNARDGEVARIQLTEDVEVRTGIHPDAAAVRGNRPRRLDSPYTFGNVPCGAWLDILPAASDDEATIEVQVSISITEFIGYASLRAEDQVLVWQDQGTQWIDVPQPRLRLRQLAGQARLHSGESLVLGSWASDLPNRPIRESSPGLQQPFNPAPPLLIVITPEKPSP